MKKIRIRRQRTPFRKKRLFKKRRIMKKKTFSRMLNTVAEKKVYQYAREPLLIYSMTKNTLTVNEDAYILTSLTPVQGAAYNQSIGGKIFIRYIRLQVSVSSGTQNYIKGDVYLVVFRTRGNRGPPAVTMQLFFSNSGQPFMDPQYLKQDVQWIKFSKFTSIASDAVTGHPNVQAHHIFKKKFRIMEHFIRDKDTGTFYPSTGNIYYFLAYPNSTTSWGQGAVAIAQQVYTYTDV